MAKNNNLHKAKTAKNDEFYTQFSDIQKEIEKYLEYNPDVFRNQVVYCNCDDPKQSNFWKYFHLNFNHFGLKKLIATHYHEIEPTYKIEYTGEDDNDCEIGDITPLKTNGDFRSPECTKLLKEADIIVTNPPFSLFREYIAQLIDYDKKFIVIGSQNAIIYKEIFPLIQNNEVWTGYRFGEMKFRVPDTSEPRATRFWIDETGQKWRSLGNAMWLTNLDNDRRHKILKLTKKYTPEEYPKYDNYDAINVNKVLDIPVDYAGVMGVPITFMDKYNPDQFEIVGCSYDYGRPTGWNENINMAVSVEGKNVYKRLLIKHKQ